MPAQLAGRSILVVEDEPIIAMDIVEVLRAAGASVTEARSLRDALILVESPALSAAVLDHGLNDGDSSAVCKRLDERRIPFVVYTGYSSLGGPCSAGEQIHKPVSPNALVTAVAQALQREQAGDDH